MRELALFEQYLIQLRQEKLQHSHAALVSGPNVADLEWARVYAHQADFIDRVVQALRALNNDPGQFIKEYLK